MSLSTTTVVVRLDRTIQYAAAFRFFSGVSGILARPVKPAMTGEGVARFLRRHCDERLSAELIERRRKRRGNPSSRKESWIASSQGLLAMTMTHAFAISRRDPPEPCMNLSPLKSEGAGNAGRTMHPEPRVQMKKAHEHSHHGHTGTTRHSPRNGFTAYFALSPVTRLCCHRHLRFFSQT